MRHIEYDPRAIEAAQRQYDTEAGQRWGAWQSSGNAIRRSPGSSLAARMELCRQWETLQAKKALI
jgi:hypothetical protein